MTLMGCTSSCHAHLALSRVIRDTCFPSLHRCPSQGTRPCAVMGDHVETFPNVFYIVYGNNEIIYNLSKKFLLDGDGFLFSPVGLHSTPTLHPCSCSGSPRSPGPLSRVVVVVLCIREGFDFGGHWVVCWFYARSLPRWSNALCW